MIEKNKKDILNKLIDDKFYLENYKKFLLSFFYNLNIPYSENRFFYLKNESDYSEYKNYINKYFQLTTYKDDNKKDIVFLVVHIEKDKSVAKARSMQRNFIAKYLTKNSFDSAIVVFYNEKEVNWRLSLVRLDYSFSNEGIFKKIITPARRYSFLVGKEESNHTAKKQLLNELSKITDSSKLPTADQLEEIFQIEKVTKEFFELYKAKYLDLKEHLEKDKDFISEAKRCGFNSEEFSKKLLGQLAFLYFLQKKGWLGVKLIPKKN